MSNINNNSATEKQLFGKMIGRKILLVGIAGLIITQLPLMAAACAGPINQIPFIENRTNNVKRFYSMINKNLMTKETGILVGTAVASSIVSALITRVLLLQWSDTIMNDQDETIQNLSVELFHCFQKSKN